MAEQERRNGRQQIEFYVNDQPVKTDEEELTVERILWQAGQATGDTAEGEKLLIELLGGERVEHANPSERIHIKANSRFEVRSRKAPGREKEEPVPARSGGGREGQPRGGQGAGGRSDVPREGSREYESTVGQPTARTADFRQPGQGIQRTGSEGQERGQRKPSETPPGPSSRETDRPAPRNVGERDATFGGMAPGTTDQGGQSGTGGQQGPERQSPVGSKEGAAHQRVGEQEKGRESGAEGDQKGKQRQQDR